MSKLYFKLKCLLGQHSNTILSWKKIPPLMFLEFKITCRHCGKTLKKVSR